MLRHFLRGLCSNSNGRTLVAGAIGVLVGIEHLMATRPKPAMRPMASERQPVRAAAVPVSGCFKIRRTKSDLGHTYWVLQGFGPYQGFALFDTWEEAVTAANSRLRAGVASEKQLVAAGA
ncbi:MAG: hypothetical protein JO091_14925 [Acidobacteriaceae bacterium]|nr:hypothetical protein [Acidobacteriaceae bacterium]